MDPVLGEFAKYGAFALLAIIVIVALGKAVVALFRLYAESQNKRIEFGEKALTTMQANTIAIDNNTMAIEALGELIKARRR